MKRLIAAGILIIFLVVLCITHHFIIESSIDTLKKHTENYSVTYKSGNFEELSSIAEVLSSDWEKRRVTLSLFVNHNILEEIDISVESISAYVETQNYDLSFTEHAILEERLKELKIDSSLHLENIF